MKYVLAFSILLLSNVAFCDYDGEAQLTLNSYDNSDINGGALDHLMDMAKGLALVKCVNAKKDSGLCKETYTKIGHIHNDVLTRETSSTVTVTAISRFQ